jgi:hypothetical protein
LRSPQRGQRDRNNEKEALSMSRRTVEIYTRLSHPDLQEMQKKLEEIEEKLK